MIDMLAAVFFASGAIGLGWIAAFLFCDGDDYDDYQH